MPAPEHHRDQLASGRPAGPDPALTGQPAAGPDEHPALAAYRTRTRRAMTIYAAALTLLAVAVFAGVRIAYAHGELSHVSKRSAPAATPVPSAATGASLTTSWKTADRAAGGDPYYGGVVVTYSAHTVNGRDARTGEVRWHYTRSDATLCSVLQQDATTIAIYDRRGNCDEVNGFVTATGEPKWYRTLTDDGLTAADSAPNVVLTVAAHTVHVFDNAGGLDRWNWTAPAGCTVTRALAGSLGVLIGLDCGARHRLVLRDLIQDKDDWSVDVPAAMVPIAADAFVGAIDPRTGRLVQYSADKGAATQRAVIATGGPLSSALARLPRAATSVVANATDGAQGHDVEISLLDKLYAFTGAGTLAWSAPASAAPTVLADGATVAAADAGQVVLRRASDGAVERTVRLSPAPDSAYRAYSVGAGLLIATMATAATTETTETTEMFQ